jgi:hypothetical protein
MKKRALIRNTFALAALGLIGGGVLAGGMARARDPAGNGSAVEVPAEGREAR